MPAAIREFRPREGEYPRCRRAGLLLYAPLADWARPGDVYDGLVTATVDEPREGKVKSGFMLPRRHLATAPPLRLGRSAALIGRRGVVED